MRYLKGTINLRLEYGRDNRHSCLGFSNSDWGGNSEDRRSTTGYVFILGGGAISWNTKRQPTVALAQNPVSHSRTKHIDIKWHFIREKLKSGEIQLQFCSTDNMTAEILTKPLTREKHFKFTGLMGMKNVQVSKDTKRSNELYKAR